jgi:hypothetical protein
MPNVLSTSSLDLQKGVFYGPANVVMEDLVNIESIIRPRDTLAWKKMYNEKPYDFPNTYVDLPIRWIQKDPVSTYAIEQNVRFSQRYKKNQVPK